MTQHSVPIFPLKPLHLLMADDDPEDREIFSEAIRDVSPTVILEFAQNCEAVLDKLANSHPLPDIIFLDLNMPIMGGHACLKTIRCDSRYVNTSVIIFTTSTSPDDILNTFKAGASHYLPKPVNMEELKKSLQYLLIQSFNGQKPTFEDFVIRSQHSKTGPHRW